MKEKRCNFCSSDHYEERKIEYLYSHEGKHLLVSNTPVEICLNCGMIYYDAAVLKNIEQRFLNIYEKNQQPVRYLRIPEEVYT